MLPAILVIEDETTLAKNIKTYLGRDGFDVHVASKGADGLAEFEGFKPDIVLLDYNLPDIDGLQVLAQLRKRDAHIKVIMMTGESDVQVAVSAMKAGAYDYLSKPLVLKKLRMLLEKAAGQQRMEDTLSYYLQREAGEGGVGKLLGESPPMKLLKQKIGQLLDAERLLTDGPPASVLIIGETGTGKELVARALHFDGPRRERPFVSVNCGAIPANLLEAELFGYEKGAFTDARERKPGLVETADGGTLFLDEIGDVEPAAQVKLLKLLEDRVVRRLGATRDRPVDVRIISATNQPLEQAVRENRFRSDLYYRLRVLQLELPPLRELGDDILLLAAKFLEEQRKRYNKAELHLSAAAKDALLANSWPGNVRELRNCIEQAVLMAQDTVIESKYLALRSIMPLGSEDTTSGEQATAIKLPGSGFDLEAMEFQLVQQALEKTHGNVTKAAKLLGLTRDTLRYRMEKHGIKALL
ncbi:MAG: sigma-54 dependent transcriptional regulator [Pseudomonadota bacterium]